MSTGNKVYLVVVSYAGRKSIVLERPLHYFTTHEEAGRVLIAKAKKELKKRERDSYSGMSASMEDDDEHYLRSFIKRPKDTLRLNPNVYYIVELEPYQPNKGKR